jgi:cyclopropane-fatty-acyl-phospholipid synthase
LPGSDAPAHLRVPVTRGDARLAELIEALEDIATPCELVLPEGTEIAIGGGPASFRLVLRNELLFERRLTQRSLAEAYVNGDLDIEGPSFQTALRLRDELPTGIPVRQALRLGRDLLLPATWANMRAIEHHYSLDDGFFLTFLDETHHFYSQCRWSEGATTLDAAAAAKLENMRAQLGLTAGDRLLDVGGGWGGLAAYCVERGVDVTSLTLGHDSADTIRRRADRAAANAGPKPGAAEVLVEDILDHHPHEPYDHVVIFGVIEHIPTYRRLCSRLWSVLREGGGLYVDASATREKYAASAFTRDHTWRGPHSCLALQEMIGELLYAGFDLRSVQQDSDDYRRTMQAWAERFDAGRQEIVDRWGERAHRAFRLFLWGGADGFASGRLQAYTLVAERLAQPGPRPGGLRRLGHFLAASVSR